MQKPLLIVVPVAALAIIIGGYFLLGGNKNKTTAPGDFDSVVTPPPLNPPPSTHDSSSSLTSGGSSTATPSPLPPAPLPTPPLPTSPLPPSPSSSLPPSSTLAGTGGNMGPSGPIGTAGSTLSTEAEGGSLGGGLGGGGVLTPATPIPSPTPSSVKTYKIQPGDTLATIAAKFLGSSSKWEQLAKANPNVNPYNLKIGQVINLPASDLVPAHSEHGYDTAGPMAEDSASPRHSEASLATGAKTYLVKEGDTLWSIAQSHYGDGSKWSLILKANRRQLSDASKLKPGMKLVIPASSGNSDSAQ